MKIKSLAVTFSDDKALLTFVGSLKYNGTEIEVSVPNLETGMEGKLLSLKDDLSRAADRVIIDALEQNISMSDLLDMIK